LRQTAGSAEGLDAEARWVLREPPSVARGDVRPIKAERRAVLLRSIAHGRAWLEAVTSGVETVEDITARVFDAHSSDPSLGR